MMKSVNWNWVNRDNAQTGLPIYNNNNFSSEKGKSIADQRLPTVSDIKESSDNYFVESTEQYKNLYIQLGKCYTNSEKALDDRSLARRILNIAIAKIQDIEKRKDSRSIQTVKTIGELASQYIDMALKNDKTDKLFDLFNEALNQILRLSNNKEVKCILEDLEPVSDESSNYSNSHSNSDRNIFHLSDWLGDGVLEKGEKQWN